MDQGRGETAVFRRVRLVAVRAKAVVDCRGSLITTVLVSSYGVSSGGERSWPLATSRRSLGRV